MPSSRPTLYGEPEGVSPRRKWSTHDVTRFPPGAEALRLAFSFIESGAWIFVRPPGIIAARLRSLPGRNVRHEKNVLPARHGPPPPGRLRQGQADRKRRVDRRGRRCWTDRRRG